MALPASGAISLSQVNVELGLSATAQIGMNDAAVRTLFGVPSGAISMSDGYGKANQFAFTISSNQTNANLATLATAAGWNGTSKVIATINSGIYCSSNSTGTPGLTVNGSFPGGVELINNGFIVGMGGGGGNGASRTGGGGLIAGTAGSAGGLALSVASAVSINNAGTIGGGGGGGGGGGAGGDNGCNDNFSNFARIGGGGGGGGRTGAAANSAGGSKGPTINSGCSVVDSQNGSSGTQNAAGAGGAAGYQEGGAYFSGAGGAGGGWGATGFSGAGGHTSGGYGGGGAGGAVSGNSNVTWIATGTRLGAIT
jgi:hypothetical protein